MALRSSAGVEIGAMLNFSTRTFRTAAETKAGRVGPRRMFLMPRCKRVRRMATAFCSYQLRIMERGKSLTPQSKALARARAICTAE